MMIFTEEYHTYLARAAMGSGGALLSSARARQLATVGATLGGGRRERRRHGRAIVRSTGEDREGVKEVSFLTFLMFLAI